MAMTTVVSDNFNRTDANPIGAPWTTITGTSDTQIVSNQVQASTFAGPQCASRYGDGRIMDMRTTITAGVAAGGETRGLVRVSTTAYTAYSVFPADEWRMERIVAGAFTIITNTSGNPPSNLQSAGVQAVGSTIKVYEDGSEILSQTDTTILEGTWGIGCSRFSAPLSADIVDDFVGETDISSVGPTTGPSLGGLNTMWW